MFRGKYGFLSNFYIFDGEFAEKYYQARKAQNEEDKNYILSAKTPGQAKRRGRKIDIRPDWEEIKVLVMADVIAWKFKPSGLLAARLLATEDMILIEENYWGDNFWGNCTCPDCEDIEGQNMLGKLLMAQRDYLRAINSL